MERKIERNGPMKPNETLALTLLSQEKCLWKSMGVSMFPAHCCPSSFLCAAVPPYHAVCVCEKLDEEILHGSVCAPLTAVEEGVL